MKKTQYIIINNYKHKDEHEKDIKKVFNQKLLKVIISSEQNLLSTQ